MSSRRLHLLQVDAQQGFIGENQDLFRSTSEPEYSDSESDSEDEDEESESNQKPLTKGETANKAEAAVDKKAEAVAKKALAAIRNTMCALLRLIISPDREPGLEERRWKPREEPD